MEEPLDVEKYPELVEKYPEFADFLPGVYKGPPLTEERIAKLIQSLQESANTHWTWKNYTRTYETS